MSVTWLDDGPKRLTERGFQARIIDAAHLFGWRVAHFRPARTASGGWVTPVSADGAGFPDLVLVNPTMPDSEILYREVKTDRGRLTGEQAEWGAWLEARGGNWGVWRPQDWGSIMRTLSHGRVTVT